MSSSPWVGRRRVSGLILSFGIVGSFSATQQHLGCIAESRELHGSGDELRAVQSASGISVMPGYRDSIPSKDKQKFGAVSCSKRSIETQTAVKQYRQFGRAVGFRPLESFCPGIETIAATLF